MRMELRINSTRCATHLLCKQVHFARPKQVNLCKECAFFFHTPLARRCLSVTTHGPPINLFLSKAFQASNEKGSNGGLPGLRQSNVIGRRGKRPFCIPCWCTPLLCVDIVVLYAFMQRSGLPGMSDRVYPRVTRQAGRWLGGVVAQDARHSLYPCCPGGVTASYSSDSR